ncbi:unnamed protein product [Orchesella dallaii]|uniref:Uncharacterized protein n=1 Tax=Orchesella dallaii TaxID=48710 RepID=A0ABP1SB93_9HEXA
MDNIDFEVTDAIAKTMSKKMLPSALSKSKTKKGTHHKGSTASTASTSSTASNVTYDGSRRRSSNWEAMIHSY